MGTHSSMYTPMGFNRKTDLRDFASAAPFFYSAGTDLHIDRTQAITVFMTCEQF